jgi:hypothetical protein
MVADEMDGFFMLPALGNVQEDHDRTDDNMISKLRAARYSTSTVCAVGLPENFARHPYPLTWVRVLLIGHFSSG